MDLITLDTLQKIGMDSSLIRPVKLPLTGFSQIEKIQSEGVVTLMQRQVEFTMVNLSMAYNVILGRPSLNAAKVVVCTYHLKLKFPASYGVGKICGD